MEYKVELEEIDRQLTIRIDRTRDRIGELEMQMQHYASPENSHVIGKVGEHLTAYSAKIAYAEGMVEAYNEIRGMYRHQYGYYHIDGSVKGYKEVEA